MGSSIDRQFEPIDFKTRFPALDGIRALAVTMVFALHFGAGSHGGLLKAVKAISTRGGMGVDLFFVLSGFLITGILFDTQSDSRYFARFFGRRSIRIFPVFYLTLAILLLLTPILKYVWKAGYLAYPLYMGNVAMAVNPSLRELPSRTIPAATATLVHLWSLCVEEQFYFLWPLVVWTVRDRIRLIWTASVLSAVALILRSAFVLSARPEHYELWMQHQLPFRMDTLLIGAILAFVLRGPEAGRWQRRSKWYFLVGMAVVLAITATSPSVYSAWYNTVGFTAVAMTSAGLIGTALRPGSTAYRVFHLLPLRILGKYSYGFYVYHLIWGGAWSHLELVLTTRLHSSVVATAIVDVLSFALTFAVAKLSYDCFEMRFLRWKRRFEYDSEQTTHRHAFY